jgi:YD repeat-containing protein
MTDPRGGVTTNVYDPQGRVTSQTDPMGRTTTFAYTPAGTTITFPNGAVTVEGYTQGRLVSETQAYGTPEAATWAYAYDPATAALTSVTNPDGETTTYAYDTQGNVTSVTDALGRTTAATYNSFNEPTSVTTPSGETTTYTYDTDGNLLSVSTPDGPCDDETREVAVGA